VDIQVARAMDYVKRRVSVLAESQKEWLLVALVPSAAIAPQDEAP